MVGGCHMNLPHTLEGFKDEYQRDEDREALFSEACKQANDVACISGHKNDEEQRDPHSNPEAELEIRQVAGFGELEENLFKHKHRSCPTKDDKGLTGKDGKEKVAHAARQHHLHWSLGR